jgi:hypothetical protein
MLDFFAFAKIRINERKVKLTAYFAATCRLSGKIYAASRVTRLQHDEMEM